MEDNNLELQELWKNNQLSVLSYLFLENYKYLKLKYERDNDEVSFKKNLGYLYDEANKMGNNRFTSIENIISFAKEESKLCYEWLEKIKIQIKNRYIENQKYVYHITLNSVRQYQNGVIPKTKNLNQYETELGEWVFGSTVDLDKNAYLARPGSGGMILLDKDSYIFGSDCLDVKNDKAMLKQNAYIYKLKTDKFTPVVRINFDGQVPFVEFGEEWISNQNICLTEDCVDITEYNDVTNLLYNIQIYTSLSKGVGNYARTISDKSERYEYIKSAIEKGELRYINGELNINNKLFEHII